MSRGVLRLVIRRLLTHVLSPDEPDYLWVCACGRQARGPYDNRSHVVYLAQRHQWHAGVGHPMPDVVPVPRTR